MSFDLYFQPLTQGKPLAISRSQLRSLFPVVEQESEPDYWKIRYDSLNVCHLRVTPASSAGDLLSSFSVERPCGDPRFWAALFQVLNSGPIVLYFPGGPPVVANDEILAALPKDASDSLGEPRRVRSGAEICSLIREH